MSEPIDPHPPTPIPHAAQAPHHHLATAEEERRRNNAIIDDTDRIRQYERTMTELDRLGDEIAVLSAQIQAATYELLIRIAEFDRREGWLAHGARSCAHWLVWRTGLASGAAREWVRVARALEHLPLLSEGLRKGEISFSKARALTRIATPETDGPLVQLARAGTAAHVERVVRACRRYGPQEERDRERWQHAMRYVEVSRDEDGMYLLRARLDSEAGAVLMRALDAAGEALHQQRKDGEKESEEEKVDRQAGDGALAKTAPTTTASSTPEKIARDSTRDGLTASQRRADALALIAESALAGGLDPGTRGDRYHVVVHVDAPVLADPAEQGVSCFSDGQRVSAETCRRLACDASTVVMTHGGDGSVLDVGRRTRTISPALRRALVERDGGCRFPGCGLLLCDAHHVKHWADGGETSLANTLLMCRFHHRLVHEEAFQLKRLPDGELEFRRPDGRLLPDSWLPPPSPVDPFEALVQRLEDGEIRIDPDTATPLWEGESRWDFGEAVSWLLETAAAAKAKRDAPGAAPFDGKFCPDVDLSIDGQPVPDEEPDWPSLTDSPLKGAGLDLERQLDLPREIDQ